ncbi:MAG: hypothetical protein ACI90E_001783, partial [Yoonia sp.]
MNVSLFVFVKMPGPLARAIFTGRIVKLCDQSVTAGFSYQQP